MKTRDYEIIQYEKRRKERLEALKKLEEPINDDVDPDFVLDKFYDNYMDGPY